MLKSSQSDHHGLLHLTLSSAYLKGRISREERLRMALQGKEEPQQDGLKTSSVVSPTLHRKCLPPVRSAVDIQ